MKITGITITFAITWLISNMEQDSIDPWGASGAWPSVAVALFPSSRGTSQEEHRHVLAPWHELDAEEKRKLEASPCRRRNVPCGVKGS